MRVSKSFPRMVFDSRVAHAAIDRFAPNARHVTQLTAHVDCVLEAVPTFALVVRRVPSRFRLEAGPSRPGASKNIVMEERLPSNSLAIRHEVAEQRQFAPQPCWRRRQETGPNQGYWRQKE